MLENLNEEIISFKETAIMQIANFGRKYQLESGNYIYPAWFGEGDTSTSNLINNKTIEALNQGKTLFKCRLLENPSNRKYKKTPINVDLITMKRSFFE